MHAPRQFLVVALLAGLISAPLHAQSDSLRMTRLSALGRLFGVVKYFHPAFLDRDVPWDSAVVVATDAVNAAKGVDDYRTAIANLLGALNDPATRVTSAQQPSVKRAGVTTPSQHWEVSGTDSTLVIAIPDFEDFMAATQLLNGAAADIRRAPTLVFDLRGAEPDERGTASFVFANSIQGTLPTTSIRAPAHRLRRPSHPRGHSGWPRRSAGARTRTPQRLALVPWM